MLYGGSPPRPTVLLRTSEGAGMIRKAALIACMRKKIVVLNIMIKNKEPWRGEMAQFIELTPQPLVKHPTGFVVSSLHY